MDGREKTAEILRRLKKEYPEPKTALHFGKPFELLVAAILSAQATDALVNRVTPGLFKKYPAPEDFAAAPLEELREAMSSINLYRAKAKNIQESAKTIVERFGGKVPRTMAELTTLPGIARKTANVILSAAYGINEGIAVDTHVGRLAQRLGLSKNENPVKIEADLMAITPQEAWGDLSFLLILHGRNVCHARKPEHRKCVLYDICPSRNI